MTLAVEPIVNETKFCKTLNDPMDRNNKRWKTIGPMGAYNSCFKDGIEILTDRDFQGTKICIYR